MFRYIVQLFRNRLLSLSISVLALAIAIAGLVSCLDIRDAMQDGKPQGIRHQGSFFTLSVRLRNLDRMAFYFQPQQIINLQAYTDDRTEIVAVDANGVHNEKVTVNGSQVDTILSFVSDNYFDVLDIEVTGGNPEKFYSTEEKVCLVSSRFLSNNNLTEAPPQLLFSGESYRVVGVVPEFSGMFSDDIEVWIPWQYAHHFLALEHDKKTPFLHGLFWAIVTTDKDNSQNLPHIVETLKKRTEVLGSSPTYDGFYSAKGITHSIAVRDYAEESTQLYFYISLLMFFIAIVNLSTWSSLTRLSKLDNELTFLRLGMGYGKYIQLNLLLVLIPVLMAFLLAIPWYFLYTELLMQEPGIKNLFARTSSLQQTFIWQEIGLMLFGTVVVTYFISALIARLCGVHFSGNTFNRNPKPARSIFYVLTFVVTTLTSINVIFAMFILQYTHTVFAKFNNQTDGIYFSMQVFNNVFGSVEQLQNLKQQLQNENPDLQAIGVAETNPLSSGQKAAFSIKPYTNPDVTLTANQIDQTALDILGVKVIKGSGALVSENQLLVDSAAEQQLKQLTGKDDIINMSLYDQYGEPNVIIGVTNHINYSTNPLETIPVVYRKIEQPITRPLKLVIKGEVELARLDAFAENMTEQGLLKMMSVSSFAEMQSHHLKKYFNKILISLLSITLSFLISLITIIALVQVYFLKQKRKVAIYSALGMTTLKLWWFAARRILAVTLLGSVVGVMIFLNEKVHNGVQQIVAGATSRNLAVGGTIAILLLILTVTAALLFSKLFVKTSIFDNLRNND